MRFPVILSSLVFVASSLIGVSAGADDTHFKVTVDGAKVTVAGAGGFKINKEGPWKVKKGADTVADVSKFKFGPGDHPDSVSVDGLPKGDLKVVLFVCKTEGDKSCERNEATVTVK